MQYVILYNEIYHTLNLLWTIWLVRIIQLIFSSMWSRQVLHLLWQVQTLPSFQLRVDFFTFIMFSFRSYWTRVMEYQAGENLLRRILSQKIAEIIFSLCQSHGWWKWEKESVCKEQHGLWQFPWQPQQLFVAYQLSYSPSLPKGLLQKLFNKIVNISKIVCIYTIIIIKRNAFLSSVFISR